MQRVRTHPNAGVLVGLVLGLHGMASSAGVITSELQRVMASRGSYAETPVIVRLANPLDQSTLAIADRSRRDNRLWQALKARAAGNRAAVDARLAELGAKDLRDLWVINGLSAKMPAAAVNALAELDGVDSVELDAYVQGGRTQRAPPPRVPFTAADTSSLPAPEADAVSNGPALSPAAPAWNVAAINAPALWAMGQTGRGVVVAMMDTGVDLSHPDLHRKWRGGRNSWFDPHGEEPMPYDALGHGTQSTGVAIGGAGFGVAPDARWIGVRLFSATVRARLSDFHLAFQWLMDPDGDAATIDAPDVVNASWALTGRAAGTCRLEFADDVRALRNAGIAVVFASGNDGPGPGTSNSPGNNPGVISVGAVDSHLTVLRQGSRGPSACDGEVFPRLVAPGANVRTTDLSHGAVRSYTQAFGTSLAAPHVAGALALLAGAFPSASVAELEAALVQTARDLGEPGPDNSYGYGLLDAKAAFDRLAGAGKAARPARGQSINGSPTARLMQ